MSLQNDLRSLNEIASRLPFHIDAVDEINQLYRTNAHRPNSDSERIIDLWTYCFIRRYYVIKFIREKKYQSGELESVVEQTYKKVEKGRRQLTQDDRYAQWVSVVCKNNFINFVTRRSHVSTIDDASVLYEIGGEALESAEEVNTSDPAVDSGMLYVALARAIDRLPPFLQNVVRMRFVEQLSYDEISRLTGHSVPTVRAYIHKACLRFRKDPGLLAFKSWYG